MDKRTEYEDTVLKNYERIYPLPENCDFPEDFNSLIEYA